MRTSTVRALAGLAVAASVSDAQEPRLAVELTGGRAAATTIYDHAVYYSGEVFGGPGMQTQERLSLGDGTTAGARLGWRFAGPWRLTAEVGRGSARYTYVDRAESDDGLSSITEYYGPARRIAFGLGIARRSRLFASALFVEPEIGAAMHKLRVGTTLPVCPPAPPSMGFPTNTGVDCVPSKERWERTYTVPSVGGGLTLGYRFAQRASVHLRGQYSVGRTSTEEGFWQDLIPQLDFAEAPKSQQVRSVRISAGVSVSP